MNPKKSQIGSSLLDTVLTLVFLLLIGAYIVPNFTSLKNKSHIAEINKIFKSIVTLEDMYYQDNNKFEDLPPIGQKNCTKPNKINFTLNACSQSKFTYNLVTNEKTYGYKVYAMDCDNVEDGYYTAEITSKTHSIDIKYIETINNATKFDLPCFQIDE
jgi:hypothetical protein